MYNSKIIAVVLLIIRQYFCDGYNILAIFPYHGRSHMGVLKQVAKSLATRGHQVDVMSHFPLDEPFPNYKDILRFPQIGYAALEYKTFKSPGVWEKHMADDIKRMCDYLGLPEVSKLIKNQKINPTYDLLLVHDVSAVQCFTAMGYKMNVPVVNIVTTKLYPVMNRFVGNPLNIAISPNSAFSSENSIMTFWDRFQNLIMILLDFNGFYRISHQQEHLMTKYLGNDIPHYRSLEKNIALILSNSHYSLHGVQPKVPSIIEIGGIHIKNVTTSIEVNLAKFLDDSEDGFIYFSFGSMAVLESFPSDILQKLCSTFKKISPVRVVIRISNPKLMPDNVPDNVLMHPWLPQLQILQHKNIKGFVTHGGAHGTQEAVYYAVPMVCIPLFYEQHMNCDIVEKKNVGLKLNLESAKQKDFDRVFTNIVSNSIYKKNSIALSALYRDRPRAPSEESTYWIEYIIRHGRNALRSPALDLEWWQIELFDIYIFIATCFTLAIALVIFFIQKIFSFGKNLRTMSNFGHDNASTKSKAE